MLHPKLGHQPAKPGQAPDGDARRANLPARFRACVSHSTRLRTVRAAPSAPKGLRSARRAIATLEFALIAPVMFVLLSGTYDVARVLILWSEVNDAANTIAITATNIAVANADGTVQITYSQAQQALSLVYAEMPWVRLGIEQGARTASLSSISFQAVTGSCTPSSSQNCYIPVVGFSLAYADSVKLAGNTPGNTSSFSAGNATRSCTATITQIGPTDAYKTGQTALNTLRTDNVTSPDPIMVADVSYTYTPIYHFITGGTIVLQRTVFSPLRSGTTAYVGGSNATGNCSGNPTS